MLLICSPYVCSQSPLHIAAYQVCSLTRIGSLEFICYISTARLPESIVVVSAFRDFVRGGGPDATRNVFSLRMGRRHRLAGLLVHMRGAAHIGALHRVPAFWIARIGGPGLVAGDLPGLRI